MSGRNDRPETLTLVAEDPDDRALGDLGDALDSLRCLVFGELVDRVRQERRADKMRLRSLLDAEAEKRRADAAILDANLLRRKLATIEAALGE